MEGALLKGALSLNLKEVNWKIKINIQEISKSNTHQMKAVKLQ